MAAAAPSTQTITGTVVFTDIVGFTEYTALRGDEEALQLLATQERLVRETLPASARIVKELGDGLLLWFADACEALATSFRLLERFEKESTDSPAPLWVRVGMHSGRQTRRGDDLVGHNVNIAARVVDLASPNEVLLSAATLAEIDGKLAGVTFEELGPVVMKGIPDAVRLYRALPAA